MIANDLIALATGVLQALAVEDLDVSAAVFDETSALQDARRDGHGGAVGPQHLRKEFVSQRQHRRRNPVLGGKEPARQSRFQLMEAITGSRLRHLRRFKLRPLLQEFAETGTGGKTAAQAEGLDAEIAASHLD